MSDDDKRFFSDEKLTPDELRETRKMLMEWGDHRDEHQRYLVPLVNLFRSAKTLALVGATLAGIGGALAYMLTGFSL